jgi:c-di-AMP phosphodiesterase-like protein
MVLYAIMNAVVYSIDKNAGVTVSMFFAIYLIIFIAIMYKRPPKFSNALVKYAANYDKIQNRLLKDLVIPYAIVDLDGTTLWANEAFMNIIGDDKCVNRSIGIFL